MDFVVGQETRLLSAAKGRAAGHFMGGRRREGKKKYIHKRHKSQVQYIVHVTAGPVNALAKLARLATV